MTSKAETNSRQRRSCLSLLLVASLLLPVVCLSEVRDSLSATSQDTNEVFVNEKYGYAFSAPPKCIAKVSIPDNYFKLEGSDNPQFQGHVENMNAFFRDSDYLRQLAEAKVTFKSTAMSATIDMYEARGDRGTGTGRVDSVRELKSTHGFDVVIVHVTQIEEVYGDETEPARIEEGSHGFVVWVDISHDSNPLVLILNPWEATWNPAKAMERSLHIVNTLRLIPTQRNR